MERFGASLRTSSAVGLEDFVHGSAIRRRKCFYDEEGRDIRLSVPGVRWADVRLIRKDALDKFKSKCQEVFDQIYDQIAEARSMNEANMLEISRAQTSSTIPQSKPTSPPAPPSHAASGTPDRLHVADNVTTNQRSLCTLLCTNKADETDKENVPTTMNTDTAPISKGKPRSKMKTYVLANEEITGRKVTRSSIRAAVISSPPTTVARTTRSRAAKRGANPKPLCDNTQSSIANTGEDSTNGVNEVNQGGCTQESVEDKNMEFQVQDSECPSTLDVSSTSVRHSTRNRKLTTTNSKGARSKVRVQDVPEAAPPVQAQSVVAIQISPRHSVIEAVESSCAQVTLPHTPLSSHRQSQNESARNPPTQWYTALSTLTRPPPSCGTVTKTDGEPPMESFETLTRSRGDLTQLVTPDAIPCLTYSDPHSTPEGSVPREGSVGGPGGTREGSVGGGGGKRLRSVSLEKISLGEIAAKRISLSLGTPTGAPEANGGGGEEEREREGVVEGEEVADHSANDANPEAQENGSVDSDEPSPSCHRSSGYEQTVSFGDSPVDTGTLPEVASSEITPNSGSGRAMDAASSETPASSGSEIAMDIASSETPPSSGGSGSERTLDEASPPSSGDSGSEGTVDGHSHDSNAASNHATVTKPDLAKVPVLDLKKSKPSPWAFLAHKTHFHLNDVSLKTALLPSEGRAATFLSPTKASPNMRQDAPALNGLPHSFLAKSSPQQIQKAVTRVVRQHKLLEHIQRKEEAEERRIRELEERKLQEAEMRKKRNAERAQRAAERRQEQQNKRLILQKKVQEHGDVELSKNQHKLTQMKTSERIQKTKKHNERVAAVLARKKQEEEQKARKLQQIEEDRMMTEELHKQRLEREEEERQARRAEKLKQDRERQQLKEEEEKERQTKEAENKPDEEDTVQPKFNKPKGPLAVKKQEFKQLLASTCTVNMATSWKQKITTTTITGTAGPGLIPACTTTVTKTKAALPSTGHNISTEDCLLPPPSVDTDITATSDMNSTFTVDASSTNDKTASADGVSKDLLVTPNKCHTTATTTTSTDTDPNGDSYKMTPAAQRSSNYDINDLSSGDSTDEEDHPKKPIPAWAASAKLKPAMVSQEERVHSASVDPGDIFPAMELLVEVDLARIFKLKRKRFYHRSSSAQWDSPGVLKKGKFRGLSTRLV